MGSLHYSTESLRLSPCMYVYSSKCLAKESLNTYAIPKQALIGVFHRV